MKYLQTDDRDDYFDSLKNKFQKPRKYYTLRKNGDLVQQFKQAYHVRGYLKTLGAVGVERITKRDNLYHKVELFGLKLTREECQ